MNAKEFEMAEYSRPQTPIEDEVSQLSHDRYIAAKKLSRHGGPLGGKPDGLNKYNQEEIATHDLSLDMIREQNRGYERATSPGAQSQMTTSVINSNGGKYVRGQPQKI